jgi:hypothetical protein
MEAYTYKKAIGSLYLSPSNSNRFNMERNGMIENNKIANRRNRFTLIKIVLPLLAAALPTRCSQENKRE